MLYHRHFREAGSREISKIKNTIVGRSFILPQSKSWPNMGSIGFIFVRHCSFSWETSCRARLAWHTRITKKKTQAVTKKTPKPTNVTYTSTEKKKMLQDSIQITTPQTLQNCGYANPDHLSFSLQLVPISWQTQNYEEKEGQTQTLSCFWTLTISNLVYIFVLYKVKPYCTTRIMEIMNNFCGEAERMLATAGRRKPRTFSLLKNIINMFVYNYTNSVLNSWTAKERHRERFATHNRL